MFKILSRVSMALLCTVSLSQAYYKTIQLSEKAENKVVGVRISDVVKFHGNITPRLKTLNTTMLKNPKAYFGKDTKTVNNFYLDGVPQKSGSSYRLKTVAVVRSKSNAVKIVKSTVTYTKETASRPRVSSRPYSLGEANFEIQVSLADRKMVITSRPLDTKMVFPLGVGSFDEGVLNPFGTSILTPRFKVAWLDADKAIYARKKPRYFAKKPFIRVSTPENKRTGIGFHIQPMPKKNAFIRAFDSHGCIRMQEADLYMLYWIVYKNPTKKTNLVMDFKIDDSMEHPFPKRNKPFKTVVNIANKKEKAEGKKQWKLDRDNLIYVANVWKRSAPVELLENEDEDHYHNVYNYKTTDFVDSYRKKCKMKAYGFVAENSRQEKAMKKDKSGKKTYDACMKRIKTKTSKLYKWWVHGK